MVDLCATAAGGGLATRRRRFAAIWLWLVAVSSGLAAAAPRPDSLAPPHPRPLLPLPNNISALPDPDLDLSPASLLIPPSVPHRTSEDLFTDICKAQYFSGDIALTEEDMLRFERPWMWRRSRGKRRHGRRRTRRAATASTERLWEYGVIPYEIEKNFSASHRALFKQAMKHWENYTCLSFVERQPEHENYILFTKRDCGCCSFVGKRGNGAQAISIGKRCDKFGIVVHELGHVVGFWHEHTRPDRDDHVEILWQNIDPGQEYNFNKMTAAEVNSLTEPYDFSSIMHYALNTFSKDESKDTIRPVWDESVRGPLPIIGQRTALSRGDIQQTNKLYNCPKCGKTLQQLDGVFHAPQIVVERGLVRALLNLDSPQLCQWRISGAMGDRIQLNFSTIDMLPSLDCAHEYLEIRDGHYSRSPLLGRFCGKHHQPVTLLSNFSRLWIEYKTLSRPIGEGFIANYEVICGGDMKQERGAFSSPNYPYQYKARKQCVWRITVPVGYTVALVFQTFELESQAECLYDYVQIFDGADESMPLLRRLCGSALPVAVQASGNQMLVRFVSDSSVEKQGFMAEFFMETDECATPNHGCQQTCVNTLGSFRCECAIGYELKPDKKSCEDACGGVIVNAYNGTIQSPNYPDLYSPGQSCVWQIIAPEHYRISLNFTQFDIEGTGNGCQYDRLQIRSGTQPTDVVQASYCGSTLPKMFTSAGNSLTIEFRSDLTVQKTGFVAVYFADVDECEQNNGHCEHICTNTLGSYQCSCHNGFTLHENGHSCKEGGCQFRLNAPSGKLTSPGWPDKYPARKECIWYLTTTPGHRVKLSFEQFDLEPHQECHYDQINVFDGDSPDAAKLGVFCGQRLPPPITSSSNKMHLVFYSDASIQYKGFDASFTTTCGSQLRATSDMQWFFSHAKFGDQPYDVGMDCHWLVVADADHVIRLQFMSFAIEASPFCGFDFVEIFDGMTEASRLLGKFCNAAPPEIVSSGSFVLIRFKTDETLDNKGFAAVYSMVPRRQAAGGAASNKDKLPAATEAPKQPLGPRLTSDYKAAPSTPPLTYKRLPTKPPV